MLQSSILKSIKIIRRIYGDITRKIVKLSLYNLLEYFFESGYFLVQTCGHVTADVNGIVSNSLAVRIVGVHLGLKGGISCS